VRSGAWSAAHSLRATIPLDAAAPLAQDTKLLERNLTQRQMPAANAGWVALSRVCC
jgi:hypothetical protein